MKTIWATCLEDISFLAQEARAEDKGDSWDYNGNSGGLGGLGASTKGGEDASPPPPSSVAIVAPAPPKDSDVKRENFEH